jgi:hypothetical protein
MAKPSKSNLRFIKDPAMEPYYIQLDDYCYIAQKSTYSESGKEYQMTLGHYGNLNSCLEAMARDKAKLNNYDSLKEFVNQYESVYEQFKTLVKA